MLKICDIKNIHELRLIASAEVEFVGFHLISESDFKRKQLIKMCISELKRFYPKTKAILITKEKDFKVIKSILNEYEFDGIQLHYFNSEDNIRLIRRTYKDKIIIFEVRDNNTEDLNKLEESDFLLIDSSYEGGTGVEGSYELISKAVSNVDLSSTFLAGGINSNNISKFSELGYVNFDVQSSIKYDVKKNTGSIDRSKLTKLFEKTDYTTKTPSHSVGASVKSTNEIVDVIGTVDFVHIDISDGFVGTKTDIEEIRTMLSTLSEINSCIPIHIHYFTQSSDTLHELQKNLQSEEVTNPLTQFIHVNKDNCSFIKVGEGNYPAFDVSDIIRDEFDIEPLIKNYLLLCMQKEENPERDSNLNRAVKYLRLRYPEIEGLYLDRGIDFHTVESLDSTYKINIVSGKYLTKSTLTKFNTLKGLLHVKK